METIGNRRTLDGYTRVEAGPVLGRSQEDGAQENLGRIREELSLGIEVRLKALHAARPARRCVYALFPALMASGFLLIWMSLVREGFPYFLYIPGAALAAIGMNSCFLLIHEAAHGILFANPILNRWAAALLGWFGAVSFTSYQVLHIRHHDFLGGPGDPDDYDNYTGRPALVWAMHFNRLIWGTLLYLLIIPFLSLRLARPDQKTKILQEYALLAVAAAALLYTLPLRWVALGWALPFLFTNWMINLRGFSQHGITDAKDPLLASRSILPHPLIRFFLINENFHLEHHLFPAVPGCNLADLHLILRPRIPKRTLLTSYSAFLSGFLRQARTMNNRPIGLVQDHDAQAVRQGSP